MLNIINCQYDEYLLNAFWILKRWNNAKHATNWYCRRWNLVHVSIKSRWFNVENARHIYNCHFSTKRQRLACSIQWIYMYLICSGMLMTSCQFYFITQRWPNDWYLSSIWDSCNKVRKRTRGFPCWITARLPVTLCIYGFIQWNPLPFMTTDHLTF